MRAFRDAAWLPNPMPPVLVRSVEIAECTPGQWVGNCVGTNIYSAEWDIACIAPRFRPLMEAQVVIHLAGGVAEAIFRGERRAREALAFAVNHCSMDTDLERAAAVLGDLRRLTGYRLDAQHFAERTLALLLTNWCAVEALASALVVSKRIEGEHGRTDHR